MIVSPQNISVKITKRNIEHYKSIGYNVFAGDVINIDASELSNGSKVRVDVKCDYCGKIINIAYKDYKSHSSDKYPCKDCRFKSEKSMETRLTRRKKIYNKLLDVCDKFNYTLVTKEEEIIDSSTRITYKCDLHGENTTKAYVLYGEHICPKCATGNNANNARKSENDVIKLFEKYGATVLNPKEYINWNTKNLKVICNNCNNEFTTSLCAFKKLNGQLCSKCSSNISKGEYEIIKVLKELNVEYEFQHRFNNCRTKIPLPFDFYIPSKNTCIEYDGEGHYKEIPRGMTTIEAHKQLINIQRRDAIKTEYCNNNGINLIRIPYYDFNNINNIIKELFT